MGPILVCKGCSSEIVDISDLIKCITCKETYHMHHSKCTFIKKVTKATKFSWQCRKCKDGFPIPISPSVSATNQCSSDPNIAIRHKTPTLKPSNYTTEDILTKKMNELKMSIAGMLEDRFLDMQKKIKDQNDSILESIEFMSNKYEECCKKIEAIHNDNQQLKKENQHLNKRISYLEEKFDHLEQQKLENDIEIRGIPEEENENLQDTLALIAKTISLQMEGAGIQLITRKNITNYSRKNPRSVVVKFSNNLQRNAFLHSAMQFNRNCKSNSDKLNTHHLNLAVEPKPIFISEHLTQKAKYLLMQAKKFSKFNKFQYCWVKSGKIFLKKQDNSKIFTITSEDVLSKILANNDSI